MGINISETFLHPEERWRDSCFLRSSCESGKRLPEPVSPAWMVFFLGLCGCGVGTRLLCGDIFEDSDLDVSGIEGIRPAAA